MSTVEQIENGVRVRCTDGTEIVCKPLTLKTAKRIIALWNKRFAPAPAVSDPPTEPELRAKAAHALVVADARIALVTIFGDTYPELEEHISPGDIDALIPDFFWSATGAIVPAETPESSPIGTPSTGSTLPSGANSPT